MDGTLYIIHIVDIVLRHWAVNVDKDSIRNILCSDPTFPSIKALHDTLAFYGLKSNVYQADFEHIIDKPYCVIHTNQKDGHFYYIKEIDNDKICLYDGRNHVLTKSEFLELWDGVVLLIEEKEKSYSSSRAFSQTSLFVLFLTTAFLTSVPLLHGSFSSLAHLLLDVIGLALSCLMYGQEVLSFRNIPFCHIGEHFDCSAVSKANPLKHIIPFGLPEIGVAFFVFDWLFLLIGEHHCYYLLFIYWLAVGCMVALIAYQIIVIRKYCLYCLCISFVVFVKPFLACADNDCSTISIFQILTAAVIAVCITTILIVYGKTLEAEKGNSLKLLTIKRTPYIFDMLLHRKPQMNIIKDYALVFGNENAKILVDTIVSLDCRHCKRMVNEMCALLERVPDAICWRVYIDGINVDSDNSIANNRQLYVVSQYLNDRSLALRCLKEWDFSNTDYAISPSAKIWYANLIGDIRKMGVEHYPMVLFNNHPFPSEYKISDMGVLINDWLQRGGAI